MNDKQNNAKYVKNAPLPLCLVISHKQNKPCLEVRKVITDMDSIKFILTCAYREIPIIAMPKFSDKIKSINSLVEKGIIYKEGEEYFFTF